jgi:hypothetical protein
MQQRQLWAKWLLCSIKFYSWPSWSPDLTPCEFFVCEFVKEAVCVRPLPTTLVDLKTRIRTAVNSVTRHIPLRVWDEFSYRVDVIRAAGGGTLNICKLYCECNQIYFTSYLSLVLCLICRLTKLSPSFLITRYLKSWVNASPSFRLSLQ